MIDAELIFWPIHLQALISNHFFSGEKLLTSMVAVHSVMKMFAVRF